MKRSKTINYWYYEPLMTMVLHYLFKRNDRCLKKFKDEHKLALNCLNYATLALLDNFR